MCIKGATDHNLQKTKIWIHKIISYWDPLYIWQRHVTNLLCKRLIKKCMSTNWDVIAYGGNLQSMWLTSWTLTYFIQKRATGFVLQLFLVLLYTSWVLPQTVLYLHESLCSVI